MNTIENSESIPELIQLAIELQKRGLHLQSGYISAKAATVNPHHPDVLEFFRVRTKRSSEHDDYYYEEPQVTCCCCPCCTGNLTDCLCQAAICDFCCVPGGCCVIGK